MNRDQIRAFVAIKIPIAIQRKITNVQAKLRNDLSSKRISWTKTENIHLTLKFLGDTDQISEISDRIEKVVSDHRPFEFSIANLGAFPNSKRTKVIWFGINNGNKEIVKIAKELDRELADLGFPIERRPFTPHLTIARPKIPINVEQFLTTQKIGEINVDEISLIRSQLDPRGAIYTPIKHFKLLT